MRLVRASLRRGARCALRRASRGLTKPIICAGSALRSVGHFLLGDILAARARSFPVLSQDFLCAQMCASALRAAPRWRSRWRWRRLLPLTRYSRVRRALLPRVHSLSTREALFKPLPRRSSPNPPPDSPNFFPIARPVSRALTSRFHRSAMPLGALALSAGRPLAPRRLYVH